MSRETRFIQTPGIRPKHPSRDVAKLHWIGCAPGRNAGRSSRAKLFEAKPAGPIAHTPHTSPAQNRARFHSPAQFVQYRARIGNHRILFQRLGGEIQKTITAPTVSSRGDRRTRRESRGHGQSQRSTHSSQPARPSTVIPRAHRQPSSSFPAVWR